MFSFLWLFERGALHLHFAPGPTNGRTGPPLLYGTGWRFQGARILGPPPTAPLAFGIGRELVRACHPLGSFSLLGGVKVLKVPAPPLPTGAGTPWAVPRRGCQVSHFRFQPFDLCPHSPELRGSRGGVLAPHALHPPPITINKADSFDFSLVVYLPCVASNPSGREGCLMVTSVPPQTPRLYSCDRCAIVQLITPIVA